VGGDEFTVLLNGLSHEDEAEKIASQLVSHVSAPMSIEGRKVEVSVSVGIATYPQGGCDLKALLRNSDIALYQAKARGRNCYEAYSSDIVPFLAASRFSDNPV
jgi:diguanylate cyclase (GGDEF)-like protein